MGDPGQTRSASSTLAKQADPARPSTRFGFPLGDRGVSTLRFLSYQGVDTPRSPAGDPTSLRRLALLVPVLIYGQIVLGAFVRHFLDPVAQRLQLTEMWSEAVSKYALSPENRYPSLGKLRSHPFLTLCIGSYQCRP